MHRLGWVVLATVMLIAIPTASAQTAGAATTSAPTCQPSQGGSVATTAAAGGGGSDATTATPAPGGPPSGPSGGTVPVSADADGGGVASISGTPTAGAAQDPEPSPGPGEPQPGDPGAEPGPTPEPGTPQPDTGGGGLPQTGLDVLRVALIGLVLLLIGARLRVVARRRRDRAEEWPEPREHVPHAGDAPRPYPAPLYAVKGDWNFPDPDEPAPTGLLPSTAGGRRGAGLTGLDRRPATT